MLVREWATGSGYETAEGTASLIWAVGHTNTQIWEDNPDLAGSPGAAAQTEAPDRAAKCVAGRGDGRACNWQASSEAVIRH